MSNLVSKPSSADASPAARCSMSSSYTSWHHSTPSVSTA
jgi:hypothetical protein